MSDQKPAQEKKTQTWREQMYEIIFEADTRAGKAFDIVLLIAILMSILVIMLESVKAIDKHHDDKFNIAEWFFTILFTIEYVARIICARRPLRYIFSFYGIVDLLSILPTYLVRFAPGEMQRLGVIRALRLLRVFRIFKLGHMLTGASELRHAIWTSRSKITVFLTTVLIAVVIEGAALHLVEDSAQSEIGSDGFDSIPESMYWAIVTMTTVGYGDVTPITPLGKCLAAMIMFFGYSLIIVPTGIVSAELAHSGSQSDSSRITTQVCPECMKEGHDSNATFCKFCGSRLN